MHFNIYIFILLVYRKSPKRKETKILFRLEKESTKPVYEQIVDKLKELIIKKILKTDEKLPSIRRLSIDLKINPNTLQKAYNELKREGYIYSIKGKGFYVSTLNLIQKEEKIYKEIKPQIIKLIKEGKYLGLSTQILMQLVDDAQNDVDSNSHHLFKFTGHSQVQDKGI